MSQNQESFHIYGVGNDETILKLRDILDQAEVEHEFFDFKDFPPTTEQLEKWAEYEKVLDKEYQNPEKLNEIFVNVTDDLSYARTFYKNRSVRVYLNGLAQKIFTNIYKNKKEPT